jgi:hypothetical protein
MSPRRLAKIQEFVSGLVTAGGCDSNRQRDTNRQQGSLLQQQRQSFGFDAGSAELTFRDAAFLGVSDAGLNISCLQQLLRLQAAGDAVQFPQQQQQQQQQQQYDRGAGLSDTFVAEGSQLGWFEESSLVQVPSAAAAAAAEDSLAGSLVEEPSECSTVHVQHQRTRQLQQQQQPVSAGGSSSWQEGSLQCCSQDSAQVAVMQSQGALKAPGAAAAAVLQLLQAAGQQGGQDVAAAAAAAAGSLQEFLNQAGGQPGDLQALLQRQHLSQQQQMVRSGSAGVLVGDSWEQQQRGLAASSLRRHSIGPQPGHQGRHFPGPARPATAAAAAEGAAIRQQQGPPATPAGGGEVPETLRLLAGLAALGLASAGLGSVDSTAASGGGSGGGVGSEVGCSAAMQSGVRGSAADSTLQLVQQLAASMEHVLSSLDVDSSKVVVGRPLHLILSQLCYPVHVMSCQWAP